MGGTAPIITSQLVPSATIEYGQIGIEIAAADADGYLPAEGGRVAVPDIVGIVKTGVAQAVLYTISVLFVITTALIGIIEFVLKLLAVPGNTVRRRPA